MKSLHSKQRHNRIKQLAGQASVPPRHLSMVSSMDHVRMSKRQSAMELSSEVAYLKQQKNKDQDQIQLLKVEIAKLDQAFRKFKATVPRGFNKLSVHMPDFIECGQ